LSGGNQQKVVLAKWLRWAEGADRRRTHARHRRRRKAEIYRLLRGLAHDGVSILMISSDMEEILHVSDRVAVMHEGTPHRHRRRAPMHGTAHHDARGGQQP
jgi:ribose transport system ATP-binding protein